MNNEIRSQKAPPPPPEPSMPLSHRPSRAALCAIIPGIGAVYNREYIKAVVHFSIFAGLTIIADAVGIFGLAAFAFYVFTIIDAYRTAESIMHQESIPSEDYGKRKEEINFPLWGGLLVLMGVLFLLDNLGAIRLRSAAEFWPLILIALGAYLVFTHLQSGKANNPVGAEIPPAAAPASTKPPLQTKPSVSSDQEGD